MKAVVCTFLLLRFSITNQNGRGTLTIRDVKESDQGAYSCEAINAKGLVFGIPDGVLTLTLNPNPGTERFGIQTEEAVLTTNHLREQT